MKYILLVYQNAQWAQLSRAERSRVHVECTAWHEELVKSGHSLGATGLKPAAAPSTVREDNGAVIVTDGPFAETREVLGGYETVECKDLDEAIAIARRFPALRIGFSMEVREVMTEGVCR
jgi:hypothetical protein